ncbi:DUF429 domain-containing protein [Streptomyces sp. MUM 178J]|uniref:DUF429 domain-containing protein n=1 Tax=Streptomyces sp. MUM 178J TaxID=2791991 RepID=UPI001F03B91F|nr:DUF429 domain-containing protein [Streptomyces sp. MUM 178J]WRQ78018.1 DUF429 domain-containing protein [Streptomyces sp. MUM 178J]
MPSSVRQPGVRHISSALPGCGGAVPTPCRDGAEDGGRLFEAHPEVSFWALAGKTPLGPRKKSWAGQMARRSLLEAAGVALPDALGEAGRVPPDDVLDAAAAAWSAHRIAQGSASPLPDPPERDRHGRPIAIWY